MPDENTYEGPAEPGWTRSTFCSNGHCISVKLGTAVRIRDGRLHEGPELVVDREEWLSFIAGVKAGEFDI